MYYMYLSRYRGDISNKGVAKNAMLSLILESDNCSIQRISKLKYPDVLEQKMQDVHM